MITIDGAYGEGGGQILRSTLTLSAITGQAVQVINIRAHRSKPGLRPQHLTAVRAAAALCAAHLEGAALDSQTLTFAPQTAPQAGPYTFDVNDATSRGSAGSATLILQTILLPLALADGPSHVTLRGGTNVPMSPPALYIEQVYLPTLFDMGLKARMHHPRWGLMPHGNGEIVLEIQGQAALRPLEVIERGKLQRIKGIAFVGNLPSHIPQRMTSRARSILRDAGLHPVTIEPQHVVAQGNGAGIFLLARYDYALAGFDMLGRKRLSSEKVAAMVCQRFLDYHRTGAASDRHLADQLVLPLLFADGTSRLSVDCVTRHLLTNVWVANQFGVGRASVDGEEGKLGMLSVTNHKDYD